MQVKLHKNRNKTKKATVFPELLLSVLFCVVAAVTEVIVTENKTVNERIMSSGLWSGNYRRFLPDVQPKKIPLSQDFFGVCYRLEWNFAVGSFENRFFCFYTFLCCFSRSFSSFFVRCGFCFFCVFTY